MSLRLRAAVAVGAGLLLSSLVAPLGWHALHWIAYLPLFWVLRQDTPRANRWLILLYGTVAEAAIFSWIADTITLFSNIPAPVAWAILLLFAVVFGLPYFVVFTQLHRLRARLGDLWILALPAWLVLVEWLAMRVILFPYQQGVSQYRFAPTWQLASVTGVWGLSFLVLFFNAAFGETIYRRREGRPPPWRWMLAAVVTLLVVVAWGSQRAERVEAALREAPVLRVQQVQSDKDMVHRMSHPASHAFQGWVDATRAIEPGSVDLVVWPEGAVPYQLNDSTALTLLWQLAEAGEFDLVVGAGTRARDPDPTMGEREAVRIFNSVYMLRRADREIPDDVPDPRQTWDALVASGCDLDALRIHTPYEARMMHLGGAELDGDGACIEAARRREQELRGTMKVGPAIENVLAPSLDAWAALRHQLARFEEPPTERSFVVRRGVAWWILQEGACVDRDCRTVTVRCEADVGCEIHPEAPHYDKMVPLPFGEYLPLAETFPWLAELIEGPGNFRAGTDPIVFEGGGARFATPICYEAILGEVCSRFEAPDLFVNVTNDAWFGDTAASDLHGMLAAIRAIELGVPVFRSAYAGVSFVVEPHGAILYETPLFTAVNRTVEVRLGRVDTVYGRLGDWFVGLCGLLLVVCGAVAARRQRR